MTLMAAQFNLSEETCAAPTGLERARGYDSHRFRGGLQSFVPGGTEMLIAVALRQITARFLDTLGLAPGAICCPCRGLLR